jgi:hypothetical protein
MSASEAQSEKIKKQITLDLLVKKDLLIKIEKRETRVSRMGREIRSERNQREIRRVRDTYVEKESLFSIRLARCDREKRDVKVSKLIRKDYLTQLTK